MMRATQRDASMSLRRLLSLSCSPILRSIQRRIILQRLEHSAKAVEVMRRNIKNDRTIQQLYPDKAQKMALQIDHEQTEIQREHALQSMLNADLIGLQ